jgi:hypothetical protein
MASPGLREAWTAQRNAAGELSALLRSCNAQKAGDLPSWQIPLDVYVSPCFARPGKQTSIHLWCAPGVVGFVNPVQPAKKQGPRRALPTVRR